MILGEVFAYFVCESPLSVMFRLLIEQSLPAEEVDELFEMQAQHQYQQELLFSTVVNLMSLVVCGILPSVNAAYQARVKGIGVSVQSVYNKLNGLEPQIMEALVRHVVNKTQSLIEQIGGSLPSLLEGYRVKILDGNHLAATERRLKVLRPQGSAPLPGHALVILDPVLMLAIDMFACEDGHAQERALLSRVLATVVSHDLWIADRNFCTLGFLFGIHWRNAYFVIRQHGNLPWKAIDTLNPAGHNETGEVFEQSVQLVYNEALSITIRRIVVQLKHPTRDGDTEIAILSNLPVTAANAVKIANLYQKRWRIERLFQVLEQCFQGEIDTLAYPRAALFGFAMALICYNLLAVVKATLRTVYGTDQIEEKLSLYYVADEVRRVYEGMMIAIPPLQWQPLRQLEMDEVVQLLQYLATQVELLKFRSHPRGEKKKVPKPNCPKNKPHVSTARLLAKSKKEKTAP